MAKSRSMDEQNLVRHQHHHHHHHQHHRHHNHDHRCHGDNSVTSASPLASRRFERLRLPLLSTSDRNRNQDFPADTSVKYDSQKSSPPPLPPLPPSAIIESLSAERLHPSRHHYHYRNDEEEEEDDDDMRMSANHHPPDVLADHPTYHNYRRLYHHHHQQHHLLHHHHPHQRHIHRLHHRHHHGEDDVIGSYRCPLCSVRKSRSLHLAAPRGDGAPHTPPSRAWMEWDSTEELKTLKFLKQCTAERLKVWRVSSRC